MKIILKAGERVNAIEIAPGTTSIPDGEFRYLIAPYTMWEMLDSPPDFLFLKELGGTLKVAIRKADYPKFVRQSIA